MRECRGVWDAMLQACYAHLLRWACDERGGFTKGRWTSLKTYNKSISPISCAIRNSHLHGVLMIHVSATGEAEYDTGEYDSEFSPWFFHVHAWLFSSTFVCIPWDMMQTVVPVPKGRGWSTICDESCRKASLHCGIQLKQRPMGPIDKQVQMLRSYFIPRKTTKWYRKNVPPAYSTWLCITVIELYFHHNLVVLALFYLE